MKKIVSAALVCVLLVCSVFALASCSKTISGEYQAEINIVVAKYTVTYSFKGNDVEITSVLSSALGSASADPVKATYEITEDEDGKLFISFDYGDEEAPEGAEEEGVKVAFEEGEDYIKIGLVTLNKVEKK